MKLRSGWNKGRTWPLTGARLKLLYFVLHICCNNQNLSTWKECIYGRKNYCLFPLYWSLSASTSRLIKSLQYIPCPKSALYSDNQQITFEQRVNEDVTASAYAFNPLLEGRETIILHVVPPPKWTKRIWKKLQYRPSRAAIRRHVGCSFLYNWELPSLSLS